MESLEVTAVVPRSHLYVPGDQPERLAKVLTRGADGIILDLEDAVTADRKDLARQTVTDWLRSNAETTAAVWLRVNAEEPHLDVAVLTSPASAVMLPKAEPDAVERLAALLAEREAQLGLAEGTFAIVPLIESAR